MPAPGLQSNSFDDLEDIMTPWPEDDGSLQVIVETSEDEAAPRLDPRTGAMEIPMPDGSVIIDLNPASKFGDGDESPVADPIHAFAKSGSYRVTVTVEWPKSGSHTRIIDVSVPEGTLRPAHGPPAP